MAKKKEQPLKIKGDLDAVLKVAFPKKVAPKKKAKRKAAK